ncbi:MAG: hypothetical protein V5A38_03750 [Halolamina sp.]|uniref:hypothetical protein n=1 Tax=Halolamina sp. TaxID=1940283 RepID=UPI002FC3C0BF
MDVVMMGIVLQLGLPDLVPKLVSLAGTIVLALALAALAGMVYQHLTGGIEWPDDEQEEELSRDGDDEWDYY